VSLRELVADSEQGAAVRDVLTLLADARLVTTEQDTAEVAHEALIREWPTLRDWLAEDREGLRLHRRLTEVTQEWERTGRGEAEVYRGVRLAQAQEWASANPGALNPPEQAFLAASQALADREVTEREAQRQRELEAARKLAEAESRRAEENSRAAVQLRRRAAYFAGAFVLAVVMAGAALYYGEQARQSAVAAQRESRLAYSRELVAASLGNLQTDRQLSLLLALEAMSVTVDSGLPISPDIEDALHRALWSTADKQEWLTLPEASENLAFSPDGKRLATGPGTASSLTVWDVTSGQRLLDLDQVEPVRALAFSPNGRWLAATAGQALKVIDSATGQVVQTLTGHDKPLLDVAFSPAGTRLVSVAGDRSGLIWTLPGLDADLSAWLPGQPVAFTDRWSIVSVAFSPDGRRLATTHDEGHSTLWDAATGERLSVLTGHAGPVGDVAFGPACWPKPGGPGPACRMPLATASDDQTVILWDADTGEELLTLAGHRGPVTSVAFSPDGTRIATAGTDGTLRVWDAATGQELFTLLRDAGGLSDVAFSADGTYVAAAGTRGAWIFLAQAEALAQFARERLTRSLSPVECRKFLHLKSACPALPMRPTATPLTPGAGRRLCQVIDPWGGAGDPFVQLTYQGVEQAAGLEGWEAARLAPATVPLINQAVEQFLASDCDLILAPVFSALPAIEAIARANPDQKFLALGYPVDTPPNMWATSYAADQPAFLAGYAAAWLTKTGKVGTFGGVNHEPEVVRFMDGFALGVAYFNEQHGASVEVLGWDVTRREGLFIGDFCCGPEGAHFASQLMGEGADILLPVAGQAVANGAADAVSRHGSAYVIGVDIDFAQYAPGNPDVVLTSIEKHLDRTVVLAATAIDDGTFTGGLHVGNLATGEVALSPFHALDPLIPEALKADLERIAADIISGRLKTLP
jgi:basic membrane lipoprotein Med (substrate-binding protein (PBP1-ABC) superfamily)/DNA-binding beta-propeller fold protein YncE